MPLLIGYVILFVPYGCSAKNVSFKHHHICYPQRLRLNTNFYRYSSANISKLLIGNKVDLEENRAVTSVEAREFAMQNNMDYIEASAKTAQNVEKVRIHSDSSSQIRHSNPSPRHLKTRQQEIQPPLQPQMPSILTAQHVLQSTATPFLTNAKKCLSWAQWPHHSTSVPENT